MSEPFIIDPTPRPEAEAAAIICGHNFIQALGVEDMCAFHGFVQEVLDTTTVPELERLRALNTELLEAIKECTDQIAGPAMRLRAHAATVSPSSPATQE